MSVTSSKKKPVVLLVIVSVVLLLVAGALWAYKQCTNPEKVFWGMVNQSLSTGSVTVEVVQESEGASAKQLTQYSFGAENMSRSIAILNQVGTEVRNESIGTQTADYTRYLSIETDRKSASGKPLNFSKVMGVWAKGPVSEETGLFAQTALGTGLPLGGLVIPIADLPAHQRDQLVQQIRDEGVYEVDFNDVKKTSEHGRKFYTYQVTMQPVPYAAMMKGLAQAAGFHVFDQLDPASFEGQSTFTMSVKVDVYGRHVVEVATEDESIKQSYMSYDVPVTVKAPKDEETIDVTELQKRLTELQQ